MQLNRPAGERRPDSTTAETGRRRIDVSNLDTIGVETFVRERFSTDRVSLEHRGSRTFLLVEE